MYLTHLRKVEPLRTEEGPGAWLPLGTMMASRSQLKQWHVTQEQRRKTSVEYLTLKWDVAHILQTNTSKLSPCHGTQPSGDPDPHFLTCSGSGGPGHWPPRTLQGEPTSHVLASPGVHREQLFMNVHFGRCCDAFYYRGSRNTGITSTLGTFGAKEQAHWRCTIMIWGGGQQTPSAKGQKSKYFRPGDHGVSVAMTHLFYHSVLEP